MSIELDELRAQADDLMQTQPAETSRELQWMVEELQRHKSIVVDLIDYLVLREAREGPSHTHVDNDE